MKYWVSWQWTAEWLVDAASVDEAESAALAVHEMVRETCEEPTVCAWPTASISDVDAVVVDGKMVAKGDA